MKKAELIYQLLCEDVRLEVGNKLSFMGVFQDIFIEQLPVGLARLAICNHWRGEGQFLSEVRILAPGKKAVVAASTPSPIEIPADGYANNVNFFMGLTFNQPGEYTIQTLLDSNLFSESVFRVTVVKPDGTPRNGDEDMGLLN
jgi:hypothetical protein